MNWEFQKPRGTGVSPVMAIACTFSNARASTEIQFALDAEPSSDAIALASPVQFSRKQCIR
jgi:hypothetical protein